MNRTLRLDLPRDGSDVRGHGFRTGSVSAGKRDPARLCPSPVVTDNTGAGPRANVLVVGSKNWAITYKVNFKNRIAGSFSIFH